MLYALLKIIFQISLRVFFRRIEVRNSHLIPQQGPLLLAANHPNTFMDPIAIAAITRQEVYFIAKSTVFNSPWRKWLLNKMNLIPIYRSQDGGRPDNEETFRKCFELLHQQGSLLIFPEGNSFNERCLRPLKSGTARIALGAEAAVGFNNGTCIVPVGLNYSDPSRFQSNLFINIGEPIALIDYAQVYQEDPYRAAQRLTDTLRQRLEDLLVCTSTAEEDELVEHIEAIYQHDLRQDLGLSSRQEDKFVLTKAIADSVRYFGQHDPGRVRALQDQIQAYSRKLQMLGLQDKFLRRSKSTSNLVTGTLQTTLYLLLGFPFYLFGCLTSYLPYTVPSKIASVLTGEQEFRAPIMMTAGIFSFPFFYCLEIGIAYKLSGSWEWALLVGGLLPLSGFFALQYYYRLVNTHGFLRMFTYFLRRQDLIQQVLQERAAIIQNLEEAKTFYIKVLGSVPPAQQGH